MKCDHMNQALKPQLRKATRNNHHHQQELSHQARKSLKDQSQDLGDDDQGNDQGGAQVEATQGDATRVGNDDDGGPIQPQSQVPHPRVH